MLLVLLYSSQQPTLALDPQKAIGQYVLDAWTSADGLPQNTVSTIAQTPDGYLWLGTDGGLVRFDGVSFTVFDRTNTPELKNNIVLGLYADNDGTLWIGTSGGLTRLKDGQFTAFTKNDGLTHDIVRAFFKDKEGSLWIATDGGGLNRLRDGKFTSFTTKDGLSNNKVMVIYQDREGSLWIGTYRGGLNKFRDGKFTTYTTKDGLCDDSVWTINEDRQGNLWIGTEKGLNLLKDGKFTSLTKRDGLSSDIIKTVYEDSEGNLWIGTFGGGLNRLKDGKFTSFTVADGLSNNIVRTIFEDREGSLWIGTDGGGLDRLRDGKFTYLSTRQALSNDLSCAIFEDSHGDLWIGTFGGGLNRISNGQITTFTTRQGLSNDFVISIFEDLGGSLWVGTYGGGLNKFRDGKFTHFTTKQGLANDYVFSIIEDKQGALWLSTSGGGLSRLQDGKFTSVVINNGLSNVFKVYEDREGSFWMGTSFGLSLLRNGQLTDFTTSDGLADNKVRSIYGDNEGSLWLVGDGGLNRLKNGKFTSFTGKDGLFDGAALAVVEDDRNNLWITSHKGIFRVSKSQLNDFADGKTSSIRAESYSIADGLKSNECNFGSPAAYKTRDGRLWFATVKGVAMVDPNHIKLNTLQPPIAIERVVIDGIAFNPRTSVAVPPGGGKLEFQFTALSFIAPKKVRFKYKLEGFDESWVEAGTNRTATYTNIAPGEYRFRVMACNNDGLWNEAGAAFGFYLRPHFYQTYWFYTAIVVGVLLLGFMLHRLRIRTLEHRKTDLESLVAGRTRDLLETTRQLEEANRRRADFVSGVSHELKTPLTLIRLYGETLLYGDEFSIEGRRGFYQIITRESERLTRLVDNVLDFSRIDRGVKRYSFQERDLAAVVSETVQAYAHHLRRAGFTVKVNLSSDLPKIRFDAASLAEVILNLLDNAAKYCNQEKHISVRTRKEIDQVVLEVEDRGIGIPDSEQEKIFEQFYRGAGSEDKGGYGLGLFLVKEIMTAHGGAIEVKSQVGHGSTFRLVFPLSREGTKDTVYSHVSSSN